MKDSADIRKLNLYKIRRLLWNGGEYTKQQLAAGTGLSPATCNTLLNELERSREVLGRKCRMQEVGRESVCYRINEAFEQFLCLSFELVQGERELTVTLLSVLGTVLEQHRDRLPRLDAAQLAAAAADACRRHPGVSQILVGTPSIAEHGIIRHCDLPELENTALVRLLEAQLARPVILQNDMHFKAYGYYRQCARPEAVVTLANFPAHVLPGTASVHTGTILKGYNQFAGMVGFLPFGCPREELLANLAPGRCRPYISAAIASILAVVNPETVVLTGSLLDAESPAWLRADCLRSIPEEYLPAFVYEETMDPFYRAGMYQTALDRKGEF